MHLEKLEWFSSSTNYDTYKMDCNTLWFNRSKNVCCTLLTAQWLQIMFRYPSNVNWDKNSGPFATKENNFDCYTFLRTDMGIAKQIILTWIAQTTKSQSLVSWLFHIQEWRTREIRANKLKVNHEYVTHNLVMEQTGSFHCHVLWDKQVSCNVRYQHKRRFLNPTKDVLNTQMALQVLSQ